MKVRQILCVALVALFAGTSFAENSITIEPPVLNSSTDELDLMELDGTYTSNIIANSDGDIVSLEDVTLVMENGTVFNLGAPFGQDTSDPCESFGDFDFRACFDSFISLPSTAPSGTNVLTNDGSPPIQETGIPLSTWADFTDDGAQTDFFIGRITMFPSASEEDAPRGILQGTLQTVAPDGSLAGTSFAVPVGVPEPASAVLSLIAGLACLGLRRR